MRAQANFVSLGALAASLAAAPLAAQPATVPTPPSGQPGQPSGQATMPNPGDAAAAGAAPTTNTAIDGAAVPGATTTGENTAGASGEFLDAIVVTGTRQRQTKFRSSTSVTDVTAAQITQFTPRSEADILHLIPGIRVESTAGAGGNSNITVRGLPLASGGSKYVQLQEDGLPDVEFGDIAFGNNDFWLRYDYTVDRVQAVRGGTSSTGASQAPGAVINYVMKTGETAGGRIGLSTGLGYADNRADFNYGAPVNDTLRFDIGGFYRFGKGPRDIGYTAEKGYQLKGNVTKTFDDGNAYIRFNFKRLDDRAPSFTSAPFGVTVNGNEITGYYPLAGYDARRQDSFSVYNTTFPQVNPNGSVQTANNKDGIAVRSSTAGLEFHDALNGTFTVDDRFAYSWNNGTFTVPFYGSLTNAAALTGGANPYTVTTANGTTYTAAVARFANGPLAGQVVPGATVINGNPTLNTSMNNMNHWGNDLGLTAKFKDVFGGSVTARVGYYHYDQKINMDWHWNGSLTVGTANDPAQVDLYSAAGVRLTDNGLTGYNNQWGGFDRHYDLDYSGNAPYASLNYENDHLDLDGSVREDFLHGGGLFYQTSPTRTALDVNGDGVLSVAEQNVYLATTTPQKIDYDVRYFNWSVGANYRFNSSTSVFVRASQGHRANADRLVTNDPNVFNADGSLAAGGRAQAVNPVTQQEAGIKQRGNFGGLSYGLFLTGFRSQATEFNIDIDARGITQLNQVYHTYGGEFESQFSYGRVALNANIVYTHSRIVFDSIGNNAGHTPRATPDWQFTISPSYTMKYGAVGFTYLGQTPSYPSDDNILRQRGEGVFNLFAYVKPTPKLTVSLNIANVFDAWDQAGRLDQDTVGDLRGTGALFGVPYAATNRVGFGRTFSLSASFDF